MGMDVVVVSFNVGPLLRRSLQAILAQCGPDDTVTVVDNASSDGSAELVTHEFPAVKLIANAKNVGFGAANNQGIKATSGQYVVLVNPDCELATRSLEAFATFMETRPRAAVAGGRLRYPDGGFQHSSFRFPGLGQIFLDVFPLNWRLTESRFNGRYPRDWDERAFEIDHPLGALMCVRRAAIDQVGGFDEGFFMYAEEVDWCLRFKRAGWDVWHCPGAVGVHHSGKSTGQRRNAMFVQLHRSRIRLFRKHYPRWFQMAARAITRLGMARAALGEWWQLRSSRDPSTHRAQLQTYTQVMRL
jgi:N-acetylglucosaminyl-diphospho-decaprenol L-rhamnosyltransferase